MLKKKNNNYGKKALANEMVIKLIIGVVSLVVIVFLMGKLGEFYKYGDANMECNTFIEGVNGKPAYFNISGQNTEGKVSAKLETSLKLLCPSKTVQVSENYMAPAVDLIEECYYKMGDGMDFLDANVEGINFCLYCGRIESDDDFNFAEKLKEEFGKEKNKDEFATLIAQDRETFNINEITLDDGLPKEITEDKTIEVYYNIRRGKAKGTFENFKLWLARKVAGFNSYGQSLVYAFTDNNLQTFSAVVLYPEGEEEQEQGGEKGSCYYIIPDTHYD